jgi:hypothetical protein
MIRALRPLLAFALIALGVVHAGSAAATPSLDACTGILAPTEDGTIYVFEPGTWCLDQDMVVDRDESVFAMLTIHADNVTVDCRGHRLEYTGTADASFAVTTGFVSRGITVRNCRMSGFTNGIVFALEGDPIADFLIEDNVIEGARADPLDGSTYAIRAWGNGAIRRNRIRDAIHSGIYVMGEVDIVDNLIDGLVDGPAGAASAIEYAFPNGGTVSGNIVRGLRHDPAYPENGPSRALFVTSDDPWIAHLAIRDNTLVGDGVTPATGIECAIYSFTARAIDNVITGFATGIDGCVDAGDNDISP